MLFFLLSSFGAWCNCSRWEIVQYLLNAQTKSMQIKLHFIM